MMLESVRDAPWWTEPSAEGSVRRNSSFGRLDGNFSRLNFDSDDTKGELDFTFEASRKKLTWISREEHRSSARNSLVSDRSSIQNGSAHGRSARFGVPESPGRAISNLPESPVLQNGYAVGRSARFAVPGSPGGGICSPLESPVLQNSSTALGRSARFAISESPGRGIHNLSELSVLQNDPPALGRSARFGVADSPGRAIYNVPESPARKGESVRRIRTPSADFDTAETPSSATPSRRLRSVTHCPRSASFKEGSAGVKGDHTVLMEASPMRRGSASKAALDQQTASKPRVQPATHESPCLTPILDSPESEQMVVSYLAEETDRIIRGRIRKLNLRPQLNATDQLCTPDHEKNSAGEESIANGGRKHASNSFRQTDKSKTEREDNGNDMSSDHRVGKVDHESTIHASKPVSPLLQPAPYHTRSSIGEGDGPTRTISATMENYLENRRRGLNMGTQIIVSSTRLATPPGLSPTASHPNVAELRQATQPENPSTSNKIGVGRHDSLTASRAALTPLNGNEEVAHSTTMPQSKEEYSEDPNRGRRKDSNIEPVNVQGENGFPSRVQYWAEFLGKGEMDSPEGLRMLAQQTEERTSPSGRNELGTKIAPVRLQSNGSRGHSAQERRQIDSYSRNPAARGHSQRFEDVGKSLLSDKSLSAARRDEHNSSRRSQSCRRDSVISSLLDSSQRNEAPPGSRPVLQGLLDTSSDSRSSTRFSVDMQLSSSSDNVHPQSPYLGKIEKAKFLFKDSPDRTNSRRSAVSVPESGGNPVPSSGFPLVRGQSPLPAHIDNPRHQHTSSQTKTNGLPKDLSPVDSNLSEKKKIAAEVERLKLSHKSSISLDHDIYKKIFEQAKKENNNRSIQPVSTATYVSQACMMSSPITTRPPQPSSPRASLQRWIANQFKGGFKARSSSTGKERSPQEEPRPRKKSPWRTRPAEILQGLTRKKVSTKVPPGAPLLDAHGLQSLRQGNWSESETQSPLNVPDPWHHRMMYSEPGSNGTPTHRNSYVLPSIATCSPTPKSSQNQSKNHRSV